MFSDPNEPTTIWRSKLKKKFDKDLKNADINLETILEVQQQTVDKILKIRREG